MKIVTVVGARPQFIKAAALSPVLCKAHDEILVHTGQHFDANMSEVFFEEMGIPKPKYNFGISGGSHATMTAKMMVEMENVLVAEKPDMVLLYGDTNSTLAGALTAVKLHIPIAHVEAGGRNDSLDRPEEVNRIITDHCSTLLFAPTEISYRTLVAENISKNAYVVGNIMYDTYLRFVTMPWDQTGIVGLDYKPVEIPNRYYYMTCHREEHTFSDEPMMEILAAMNALDATTIYPVHPRNRERAVRICNQNGFSNITLVEPVKYSDSVHLAAHATKIVTDSGGLQCDAFFSKVQCVTISTIGEKGAWLDTLVGKRNQVATPNKNDILSKLSDEQVIDESYQPFGDGHAADKIVRIINEYSKTRGNDCVR